MQEFEGIAEKLVRAKENIFNLDVQIERFFEEGDYPVLPQNNREARLKAIEYHKNRVIPPRFGVLVGEIIHHLRSCFDHIAWHFTVLPVEDPRRIELPVFEEPLNHDRRRSFERKIAGIQNPDVRDLIERLQPYNSPDPLDNPLWLIHDLDIIDKHKRVILLPPTPSLVIPKDMESTIKEYERAHPELDPAQIAHQFERYGTVQPTISFRDFGRRKIHPVVPGLLNLFNYTVETVSAFEAI